MYSALAHTSVTLTLRQRSHAVGWQARLLPWLGQICTSAVLGLSQRTINLFNGIWFLISHLRRVTASTMASPSIYFQFSMSLLILLPIVLWLGARCGEHLPQCVAGSFHFGYELAWQIWLCPLDYAWLHISLLPLQTWWNGYWLVTVGLISLVITWMILWHWVHKPPQGRTFLRWMINLLCTFRHDDHPIQLNLEFHLNLTWWWELFQSWDRLSFFLMPAWAPLPFWKAFCLK